MKIFNLLNEVNITDKIIKEPGRAKQLAIAWKHDTTLPMNDVARLGPRPNEKEIAAEWRSMLERTLERTNYGDLSRDFKFAEWLTKLYTTGAADWEDISGEGGDALGAWHALSQRGLLIPAHQDLNKFKTLNLLQQAIRTNTKYSDELRRIKDAAKIAQMKKDAKDVVIIDDDKYWAAVPMNYGACYVFNTTGHISTFCTGGSGGASWFQNYAPGGLIVMIVDKAHVNEPNGKWQMHAQTRQLVNSVQDYSFRGDAAFANTFPGLMKKIVDGLESHAAEITAGSGDIKPGGYNVPVEIQKIKNQFPASYASTEPTAKEQSKLV